MKKLLSIFVIVAFGVSAFCQSITTHFGDVKVKGNIVVQNLPGNTYETESTIPYLNSSRIHFGDYYFKQVSDSVWLEKPLNTWIAPITKKASATSAGYLSKVDWNTFNGKANPYTFDEGLTLIGSTVTLGDASMTANLQLMWPSSYMLLNAAYSSTRMWTLYTQNGTNYGNLVLGPLGALMTTTSASGMSSVNTTAGRVHIETFGPSPNDYSTQLHIQYNQAWIDSDEPSFPGLQYYIDYSDHYTDRSLIDKGFADSAYKENPAIKIHRIDSINSYTAGTWVTVKFDTLIAEESVAGLTWGVDSTYVLCNIPGLYYASGCGHSAWNGAGGSGSAYIRVTVNSNEKRCLQANRKRTNVTGDDDILPYLGTLNLSLNDTIRVQYQVSSTSLDWEGPVAFDNPIAFSFNLFKMSK